MLGGQQAVAPVDDRSRGKFLLSFLIDYLKIDHILLRDHRVHRNGAHFCNKVSSLVSSSVLRIKPVFGYGTGIGPPGGGGL